MPSSLLWLVLRGDRRNGHVTTQSLLYANWKHLLHWMSVPSSRLKEIQSSFHQELGVDVGDEIGSFVVAIMCPLLTTIEQMISNNK
eukprot:scaffold74615_cov72-Cyclotella_meneghiniana.AAC.5